MSVPLLTANGVAYSRYDPKSQQEFQAVIDIIAAHLSEPYSIFVYWYFLHNWPQYCFLVKKDRQLVGVIISRVDAHRDVRVRGYIGMLVIHPDFRNLKIATNLVKLTLDQMINADHVDEVSLETETNNVGALRLYEGLGFLKVKRLYRYYLNSSDAFRLILPVTERALKRVAFLDVLPAVAAG